MRSGAVKNALRVDFLFQYCCTAVKKTRSTTMTKTLMMTTTIMRTTALRTSWTMTNAAAAKPPMN